MNVERIFCKQQNKLSYYYMDKNLNNNTLEKCSPNTGFYRNGYCTTGIDDYGTHTVCAKMDNKFMKFTASKGNDLSSVVKPGENWCLCENRWEEAYNNNVAPKVIKKATNNKTIKRIKDKINQISGGKRKTKKQFLYNPNDPKKSFDVYIDKNPNDTIPIKYTTVNDVKDTIEKLEKLYKKGKYSHKRIWQVGMIMKVRLEAMLKHKKDLYKKAKNVKSRFNLANRYFKFLGKRSKEKNDLNRKKMIFK